jgi:hypothetical protein
MIWRLLGPRTTDVRRSAAVTLMLPLAAAQVRPEARPAVAQAQTMNGNHLDPTLNHGGQLPLQPVVRVGGPQGTAFRIAPIPQFERLSSYGLSSRGARCWPCWRVAGQSEPRAVFYLRCEQAV